MPNVRLFIKFTIVAVFCITTGHAQSNIAYNRYYINHKDTSRCILKLLVTNGKKNAATLQINKTAYKGTLSANKNNEAEIYNFYYLPKSPKKFLMIQFIKEDESYKANIINQEYAPMFKPYFDEKYISLNAE